jgi:hypothetical protein
VNMVKIIVTRKDASGRSRAVHLVARPLSFLSIP